MAAFREKVLNIICERLNKSADELEDGDRFREDLGADSLDLVDVTMMIEDEFDLSFPVEEFQKIKTVLDLITYVEVHQV